MKKRLLFFLDYYLPHSGGVETVFEQLIKGLISKGYHITLITSRFQYHLKSHEISSQMEIYRVGSGRISFLFFAFLKGFFLLKKEKFDFIHASTYVGAFPASFLGLLFHKKVVLTVHEVFGKLWFVYKGYISGFFHLIFEKILFLLPYTAYHCVSRYTMNSLRLLYGIPDHKLHVIHNGVDYKFRDSDLVGSDSISSWKKEYSWNGRFVVLYYGHAGKSKGLDFLIDCIPQIIKHDPDILFVFNLIDSKRRPVVLDRLHFLERFGFARQIQIFQGLDKQDLRTMVASCDVVVAPSFSEGFGSVHTETVAMQKSLITTNVASLSEVVGGKTIFVKPGSSKEIIDAILKFKDFSNEVPILPISYFDWKKSVDELDSLYGSL